MKYEKYDILKDASLVHNYLTNMVDANLDYLPYWLIGINKNPAWAKHCRVDDAELVASWYEALVCTRQMLNTDDGAEVLDGFKKHLLRSWGEHGLRFHEPYPWAKTMHSSFHEMAYIVAALNRLLENEGDNPEAKKRLAELVRGMRGLVYERTTRTFWSGDFPLDGPVYEFPNDVYIQDVGWDFTKVTGRGEESIRNGMMLHPLARTYQLFGDEVALDLATGIANHLLGISRYFNYKGEFFGHVHSSVWVAAGLVLLGRLTDNSHYVQRGRDIFSYVESLSSSFGWVPEYAQWHPMEEEHCETCCIRDMILCAFELIDAGYDEYWDMINRYARNQLTEQQIKDTSFIGIDNSIPDTEDTTYRDIDKRAVGGYSGGGEPNCISLTRFRSIAGCCVGTAPQALHQIYTNIVREQDGKITINLPIDKDDERVKIETGYPNEGWFQVTVKKGERCALRILPFMKNNLTLTVNGRERPAEIRDNCVHVDKATDGTVIRLTHDISEKTIKEVVRGVEYDVTWKGCDVVKMLPEGEPLKLYQRRAGVPKEIPSPPPRTEVSDEGFDAIPTEQTR